MTMATMTTATNNHRRRPIRVALVVLALLGSACASSSALPETASEAREQPSGSDAPVSSEEPQTTNDGDDAVATEAQSADGDPDELVEDAGTDPSEGDQGDDAAFFPELCDAEPVIPGSRVDIQASGNRIAPGTLDFANLSEVEIELPDNGVWVNADPTGGWYVVLERGSAVRVSTDGTVTSAGTPGAVPPELDADGNPDSPFRFHELFTNPLDDTRVVVDEAIAVALTTPTDFYRHGALGDAIEAAAIEWVDTCSGERGLINIAEPDVIESLSPILADIDGDGQSEIIVTLSNDDGGSRLAAFELDGTSAGESEPIGLGNRWRNQLAAGAFGPEGEVELIDVRTPHIGGIVQSFQQVVDEENVPSLVQVAASDASYTSHVNRTRNLSMGIALDLDTDSFPDVLVARSDRGALVAMTRTADPAAALQGWNIIGERELTFGLTSNIASQEPTPGRAAVALADGSTLRIWN